MNAASDLEMARPYKLAQGQVAEWLVWSRLVATSGGDLHVFLPLEDRGIDGILHRISTDEYARVQVKSGKPHRDSGVPLWVPSHETVDDRAHLVAVRLDTTAVGIGTHALVVDMPTFRGLAHRENTRHKGLVYSGYVTLPPPPNSQWVRWCVPLEGIGERLLAPSPRPAVTAPLEATAKRVGFRAEMELVRRAADCGKLNVFKAFPDLEPNEYLLYDTESREIIGIQVKSVTFRRGVSATGVDVYAPALRPSPHTWFVIFLADQGVPGFVSHCAVVPSQVVADDLVTYQGRGKLALTRELTGRMAEWRVPLDQLGARLGELTAAPKLRTS